MDGNAIRSIIQGNEQNPCKYRIRLWLFCLLDQSKRHTVQYLEYSILILPLIKTELVGKMMLAFFVTSITLPTMHIRASCVCEFTLSNLVHDSLWFDASCEPNNYSTIGLICSSYVCVLANVEQIVNSEVQDLHQLCQRAGELLAKPCQPGYPLDVRIILQINMRKWEKTRKRRAFRVIYLCCLEAMVSQ